MSSSDSSAVPWRVTALASSADSCFASTIRSSNCFKVSAVSAMERGPGYERYERRRGLRLRLRARNCALQFVLLLLILALTFQVSLLEQTEQHRVGLLAQGEHLAQLV